MIRSEGGTHSSRCEPSVRIGVSLARNSCQSARDFPDDKGVPPSEGAQRRSSARLDRPPLTIPSRIGIVRRVNKILFQDPSLRSRDLRLQGLHLRLLLPA